MKGYISLTRELICSKYKGKTYESTREDVKVSALNIFSDIKALKLEMQNKTKNCKKFFFTFRKAKGKVM